MPGFYIEKFVHIRAMYPAERHGTHPEAGNETIRMKDRKLLNIELGRMTVDEYRTSPESGIVVVLDNIRSAHNVGSAFRSCDSFKVDKIYLCGICAVPPSPEIHKSAIGAEFSVEWEHYDETMDAVARLKSEGYCVVSVWVH